MLIFFQYLLDKILLCKVLFEPLFAFIDNVDVHRTDPQCDPTEHNYGVVLILIYLLFPSLISKLFTSDT